jgi:hypothetical protein
VFHHILMKTIALLGILGLAPFIAAAQPAPLPAPPPPAYVVSAPKPPPQNTANYSITVMWTNAKHQTNSIQVLTAEGTFSLETLESSVKIDDNDIPTTVSFNGTFTPLDSDKGTIKLFLGRTVPYVTGSYSSGGVKSSSSYQQLRVGLNSTFTVTFGKRMVIQNDQNGEVSILVKRQD